MNTISLVMYTRPGCHLCGRLLDLIESCARSLGVGKSLIVSKRNVDGDPQWAQRYGGRIPVVTVAEQVVLEGRPTKEEVEKVLSDWFGGG